MTADFPLRTNMFSFANRICLNTNIVMHMHILRVMVKFSCRTYHSAVYLSGLSHKYEHVVNVQYEVIVWPSVSDLVVLSCANCREGYGQQLCASALLRNFSNCYSEIIKLFYL